MAPLRGLPFLLVEGMRVHITPPALKRERVSTVESVSETSDGARVRFSCSHDLDAAESLAGCLILASCSDFELGPLQAAFADLIGRPVVDERHGELGRVVEVMETPANDVWVVDGGPFGEVLIPVIDDVVASIWRPPRTTCGSSTAARSARSSSPSSTTSSPPSPRAVPSSSM